MKKIINLTPHDINIYDLQGNCSIIPKSGIIARIKMEYEDAPSIKSEYGIIPVVSKKCREVEHLPQPSENTVYVVSTIVLKELGHRQDVIAPDTGNHSCIRDDNGKILGVTRFLNRLS